MKTPAGVGSGEPVDLGSMLAARDARVARQQRLARCWSRPVLSLSLVSPGAVKDSPGRRALMDKALHVLTARLANRGVTVLEQLRSDAITGPELLLVADCDADELKLVALEVEELAAWGRLVDADVLALTLGGELVTLRRELFGRGPRPCLICGRPAAECIGERRHDRGRLAATAQAIFAGFDPAYRQGNQSSREDRVAAPPCAEQGPGVGSQKP